MCDTMVAVPSKGSSDPLWFAKNSDREPGEAQAVEHHPEARHRPGSKLRCTWIEIPQAPVTNEVVLSRPTWMWGGEMGANSRGLTIGNEAVFTRLPIAKTGLTGMDMLRLALERCGEAREALDFIVDLLARHEQGGRCGYRNESFRYHSAFILADAKEAWILETADRFWAARRVRGVATISNVLSIEDDFDLVSDDAYPFAKSKGWCRSADDFGFARCFGDKIYRVLTGGVQRRACTAAALGESPGMDEMMSALRDHGGRPPSRGWRMEAPCAHASWQPTRHAGQTTGSMISRLSGEGDVHWLTGTSSPCISVFKPVVLGDGPVHTGPAPGPMYDEASLFWRHEALHRMVIPDYEARRRIFEEERASLERRVADNGEVLGEIEPVAAGGERVHGVRAAAATLSARVCSDAWSEHREALPGWLERVKHEGGSRAAGGPLHSRWWRRQDVLDSVPR